MATYLRQHLMKSKNKASFVFKAADSSLEFGLRFFPLLLVMFLGFPLESAHKQQYGLSVALRILIRQSEQLPGLLALARL